MQSVEPQSPAFEAGLRAGDVISHVNGTAVQGLLHVQVVSLILSCTNQVKIQAAPLDGTTIKVGRRRAQHSSKSLLTRPGSSTPRRRRGTGDERRRQMTLFRRLSNKKAEQLAAGAQLCTPAGTPVAGGSFVPYSRSLSAGDGYIEAKQQSRAGSSDSSSSPGSSGPNSPAIHSRPSSLQGLKNKNKVIIASTSRMAPLYASETMRRQSFHAIPPSPLARVSPSSATSPIAVSTSPTVTRSPSPLVIHGSGCSVVTIGTHQGAGISSLSQIYTPGRGIEPQSSSRHTTDGTITDHSNDSTH
jgi:microtubule-associated serine/threonine kinase